jgi:hypothetical protein
MVGEREVRERATIGPQLIGGIPQALFQRIGGSVFFGGGDPLHAATSGYRFLKRHKNTPFPIGNHPALRRKGVE